MARFIPHSRPFTPSGAEWEEVTRLLAPGWVADGPCLTAFAERSSRLLGCRSGVAVSSGTTALQLALRAVGAGPGQEVLVPAYCCAALLCAVAETGASPVLVDAEPGGFNLCPRDAARRRTPRTCAIVVAHLFGHPAPIEPFLALGVPVVEDCAQSIGASEGGRPCGGAGAVAIGSFYATKVITTGQGGLVASNDAELRARIRDWVEYDQREDWQPRWSCRMSELQAALGLWQLDRLAAMLIRRRELSDYYRDRMETGERPLRLTPRHAGEIAYRCIARVPDADAVLEWLNQRGVGARRPVHRPLHHYFPELAHGYPHAEAAHREVVSLPLYPALTDAEAELVMDTFLAIPQALLRSNPSDC